MKVKLATTCFVIGTLLGPIAAFAVDKDSDRTHPITFVKDSMITARVKANLFDERMGSLANVRVDTDRKGMVVLSGRVRSQEDADKTVSITRATKGVTSVRSDMQIKKDD
jgi:hyperosmotically inducible protein